ncbi:hypothetical protein [Candidatus Nitrosocosmicus hydrocola]|uniref:hypothetical protein n=1 Tax=Candidatus Nitrosocosmicus hydrocola TaxID=1826872 RepID=UPI0011E5E17F|nr:hypothetical protein [Candidatus Nitrosocosmicus hydrocola]
MLLSDVVRLSGIIFIIFLQNLMNFRCYSVQNHYRLGYFKILVCSALVLVVFYFINVDSKQQAFAHFFGGDGDTNSLSGTQNQTVGNFVIDLLLNPSKPMVGKDIAFLTEVKSTQGDVLIELPVSYYILKDGQPVFSDPNNYTLVRQGHYDFNYTFREPGKYVLFVNIKDIFYSLDVLSVTFEIDVQVPILDRINDSVGSFLMNYYYIFVILAALVGISYVIKVKRRNGVKQTT